MTIELTDKEQAILNAACVRVTKATQEAQALEQAAQQAGRKAEALGHEARGFFRSIMELSGRNPEAHQLNWDGAKAIITENAKAEPAAEPVDNIVTLPAPKDEPPVEDANA